MNRKPKCLDVLLLTSFVAVITFQPYLFHHEIIMMETGIHLPGLRALFHGAVPYRDFLYFRGPLELYVPAVLMKVFGENMIWLPVFYCAGSVLTLIFAVVLASRLYRTRFALYLMVPVFTALTFPRVSFYYWGGMRYALGILALLLAVESFKRNKGSWMFGSGVVSCLAFWTTIEAGVCAVFAIGGGLLLSCLIRQADRVPILKLLGAYAGGFLVIFLPVTAVMGASGALLPYIQATFVVLTQSFKTFPNGPGLHPVGALGFLAALIPGSKFFQSMTPVYFYLALFGYFVYRQRRGEFAAQDSCLLSIALYGLVLYVTGFRRLDGHHFEMALQPEKILYFFTLEEIYLWIRSWRSRESERLRESAGSGGQSFGGWMKIGAAYFVIAALIGSSLGYAITRFSRRFVMFKIGKNFLSGGVKEDLSLLRDVEKRPVNIRRARGMVVPVWQAEEMEGIVGFLEQNTGPQEPVFTFPELGNFNFWADRPFVGRFPIVSFSWMDDGWYAGLVAELEKIAPRYVIMTNPGHRTFPAEWYFRNTANIKMYNDMTQYILDNYDVIQPYESVSLYRRKEPGKVLL